MLTKCRKQADSKAREENLCLKTAENELNHIRKEASEREKIQQRHQNELEVIEHRLVHGVTGQALKQQNTTKSKQQKKVDKKNALTERYSVMM